MAGRNIPALMPQVDIIIAAYNPGHYLHETLDSVIAQSLTDWQAIVIDDGSTEDLIWVDTLDQRVRRIRQDNAGLSVARNRGIQEGSSPFLAFIDADDAWLPDKLGRQVTAFETSPNTVLCSTAFEIVDASGRRLSHGYQGHATSYPELLQANGICVSTVMVRRDAIETAGMFSTEYRQVQDWDLWLRLAKTGPIIKLDTPLARYRQHGSNMSLDYRNMLHESTLILSEHEQALRADGQSDLADLARRGRRRVKKLAGFQAYDALRAGVHTSPYRTLGHLGRALRWCPRYTSHSILSWLWWRTQPSSPEKVMP